MQKQVLQRLSSDPFTDELLVNKSKKDLVTFSEYCWFNHPFFVPNAPMHNEWYETLTYQGIDGANFKRTHRIHFEAPREHAKTSCISVKYPIWRLGNNHNLRVLVVSKTMSLAKGIVKECRENIEHNSRVTKVFPDLLPDNPWSNTEFQIKRDLLAKTPSMRGVGLHGSITGGRADIILLDDPFDLAEVQTEDQRDKVAEWIEGVVIPVLSPVGELIAVGTRWHYGDYWQNLIEKSITKGGNYVVKIYRPTADQTDSSSPLKPLWPQVWDEKALLARKADIGSIKFNCLYLNDPSAMKGLVFKEEWIQYYNPLKLRFIEDMVLFMGVDPAISEDPHADWTVIVVLGFHPHSGKLYVLDVYREHLNFPDQVKAIKNKYNQWERISDQFGWAGVSSVGVESVAYQKALAQASFMQGLPVKEIKRTTNKYIRLVGLSPHFEGGRILFPDPSVERMSWLEPYILEYVGFPRGKNDDQLDATDCGVEAADLNNTGGWASYLG